MAMECIPIDEMSGVIEARHSGNRICQVQGLNETTAGKVAIIITELGTNILRHAGTGSILIRPYTERTENGVEVLALDKGKGIEDISRSIVDGYSTSSTSGTGLGAVRRLSDCFGIYSSPGKGTAVMSQVRIHRYPEPPDQEQPIVGAVCLPFRRGEPSGDGWDITRSGNLTTLLLVDGLGHGKEAGVVAEKAVGIFRENPDKNPSVHLTTLHEGLARTRGAAAAVAEIHNGLMRVRFAGAGNISGEIYDGVRSQSLVSLDGTVGIEVRKVREFEYPWSPSSLLLMYSDGISTHWSLDDYPNLAWKHPSLIAGVLYRDYWRGNDDVTVVAVRQWRGNDTTHNEY